MRHLAKTSTTFSTLFSMIAFIAVGTLFSTSALAQTRIVVIPHYVEDGANMKWSYAVEHFETVIGPINNQLGRHGFEVLDPIAADLKEADYNLSRVDSSSAVPEMAKRFAVDLVYVLRIDLKAKKVSNGCKVKATVKGRCYDSAGRSVPASLMKKFNATEETCDDAVDVVENSIGYKIGRILTDWNGKSSGTRRSTGEGTVYKKVSDSKGGVLIKHIEDYENLVNIRLDGATEYELAEVFGKVVNTVRGVVPGTIKRFRSNIDPEDPEKCVSIWRTRIQNTDPFRLQANIMKMINDILDAKGNINLKGVPYRYTPAEITLLKGIRTGSSSANEIQFVIDLQRSQDREMSGRHDPYKKKGFE